MAVMATVARRGLARDPLPTQGLVASVGGGVAANGRLRQQLAERCEKEEIELHIAPVELCTDNAVMGAIAVERYRAGLFEELDLDIVAGLLR